MNFLIISIVFFLLESYYSDDPNRLPTKCETCKYLTNEIAESLLSHNSPELIETGYNFDERLDKKKAKKYQDSEIRLIEVIEEVCERILQYNVHAERSGSLRYSKGESQTMNTLKNLKNRGCDQTVELYEEEIENWYKNERNNITLTEYLCERIILKNDDKSCLSEKFVENKEEEKKKSKKKETKKSDKNDL
ncbi:canopy -like protein [Brachionus plicatilis]|uniref:Canopy-like protein n=1 Tax=Brachionus plicatilis TaxID=10195 RepID=A0A3M7PU50_BRAPC|nr:canopy -like protein [Brachionus plicatilis]